MPRGIKGFIKGVGTFGGKKHSQETKDKISSSKKGRQSGENNPNWRGGFTRDINKYHNDNYKRLSEEKRKEYSWRKNKRNRVIKRLKIESLSHTYGEWDLLKKQYNYTCPCCHREEPVIKLTEDHIIPLSKGGSDLIENIQPLCLNCNLKKNTIIIKY